jgi:hypothetical protein
MMFRAVFWVLQPCRQYNPEDSSEQSTPTFQTHTASIIRVIIVLMMMAVLKTAGVED